MCWFGVFEALSHEPMPKMVRCVDPESVMPVRLSGVRNINVAVPAETEEFNMLVLWVDASETP